MIRVVALAVLLAICAAASGQDAQQLVEQAVETQLNADRTDHSRWIYYDVDRKPNDTVKQWVAETSKGDLHRVLDENGKLLSEDEQRSRMDKYVRDSGAQAKQHKSGAHDDSQATEMLKILPKVFHWTLTSSEGSDFQLRFTPNLQFQPSNKQMRVFAGMEGEMSVDKTQHTIVSFKGRLIHDVTFGWGLLGRLKAGGSFDVERREVGNGKWKITETHVHIQGHELLFKTISEQEDEVKSRFKEIPENESLEQAEKELMGMGE